MTPIALILDPEAKSQVMTLDIEPDENRFTVSLRLEWMDYIGKYMLSIWDAMTGEAFITNVPLVASSDDILVDLIRQIAYKGLGSLYCAPIAKDPLYEDPHLGTLNEYELVWGDSFWKS